ncbi:PspA/IM30 family protein [bacterium]|nr:PspA/IM30 family protein [bacterium]
MKLLKRISELVSANINHLLDQAEDPEVMVKQIIRDMEANIIKLRSETVRAVARQKQLEKQLHASGELAKDLEKKAKRAFDNNEQDLARSLVEKKIDTQNRHNYLQKECKETAKSVKQLKSDLEKLEDQVQEARRKKEELIRRKRAADAKLRSQRSVSQAKDALSATESMLNLSESQQSLESYEETISALEAEVEASDELLNTHDKNEEPFKEQARKEAVEKELERLKKSRTGGK